MTQLVACMGGWCRIREGCVNYHSQDREEPSERLCRRGQDGVGREVQILMRGIQNGLMGDDAEAGPGMPPYDGAGLDQAGSGSDGYQP